MPCSEFCSNYSPVGAGSSPLYHSNLEENAAAPEVAFVRFRGRTRHESSVA
jgi:hypothetical protein